MSISLNDYLSSLQEDGRELKPLPLCHTTMEFYFFEIITNHRLRAEKPCPVFKEMLVFFFYGKAKYIPRKYVREGGNRFLPVTMLFNMEQFGNASPKRMLPFDSGGFDLYRLQVKPIDYYVVPSPSVGAVKKYISGIYGTNEQYLTRKMKPDAVSEDSLWYAVKEIKYLHDHPPGEDVGNQAYTIEIQFEDTGDVWAEPHAIVIPHRMFTSTAMMDKIRECISTQNIVPYAIDTEEAGEDIMYEYKVMGGKVAKYVRDNY